MVIKYKYNYSINSSSDNEDNDILGNKLKKKFKMINEVLEVLR